MPTAGEITVPLMVVEAARGGRGGGRTLLVTWRRLWLGECCEQVKLCESWEEESEQNSEWVVIFGVVGIVGCTGRMAPDEELTTPRFTGLTVSVAMRASALQTGKNNWFLSIFLSCPCQLQTPRGHTHLDTPRSAA